MKAFISYSHRDDAMLERFHTHLAMLRRDGAIDDWYDRRIVAGSVIDHEVYGELERCEVFIALVSPDFLNSGYCYDREMSNALERQKAGLVAIVPVIVEHCDWKASPLAQFKAIPKDGKPVSDWTNKDAAWLDVIAELRTLVGNKVLHGGYQPNSDSRLIQTSASVAQSKYRVKKEYDQIDKEDYRSQAYEVIRDYFEKSCAEIDGIDGLRGRYKSLGPNGFTCTVINKNIKSGRSGVAHITVRHGLGRFFGDIGWSYAADARENSSHGGFSVESDDYRQFLSANISSGGGDKRIWLPNEAASYLWQEFIGQAGISL